MRAVVQRVTRASVRVGGEDLSSIGPGLVVLLGIAVGDTAAAADRLAAKIARLRIFADAEGRMNEPLGERETLCVSQFTLLAETSRGNRPSFGHAEQPDRAEALYLHFCDRMGAKRGMFGAQMELELVNDGPVTLILESRSAEWTAST